MNRLLLSLAAIFAYCSPSHSAADDDAQASPPDTTVASAFASRTLATAELVLQHHIDPPTRQQMILDGAKALYRSGGKPVPHQLSRQVSGLKSDREFTKFLEQLESRFRGSADRLQAVFVSGMLRKLPGRFHLMEAENLKVQGQISANRYVGTGIVLRSDTKAGRPAIPKAFYNGPAWKAGVKSGDLILAIDGKDTRTMSLADVVKLLRGGEGTVVEMKVRQPDAQDIRTLKITRGVAFIPTVAGYRQISAGKWQFRVEKSQGLAYIRINSIGSSTLHELRQVERQLRGKGVRGILLDLRYGGGTLHDIVMVADALLDGKVIGRVQTGQTVKTHKSRPGALFAGLPLAVLLDRTASSGREFLAAALQDGRDAVVVGEPTSGDGVVRRAIPVPGWNHSMVIAVGTLQRGDGTPLRAVAAPPATVRLKKKTPAVKTPRHRAGGVVPDVSVQLSNRQRAALVRSYSHTTPGLTKPVDDPLISKAVEVLNARIKQAGGPAKNSKVSG